MKIEPKHILPIVLIIINLGAAIVCAISKDAKMTAYWLAAAIINFCVTF